jgi:hypothetical protein
LLGSKTFIRVERGSRFKKIDTPPPLDATCQIVVMIDALKITKSIWPTGSAYSELHASFVARCRHGY